LPWHLAFNLIATRFLASELKKYLGNPILVKETSFSAVELSARYGHLNRNINQHILSLGMTRIEAF
jgi:hypothetical protein